MKQTDMQKIFEIIKQAGQIALAEQKNLSTQIKKDGSIVTNGDLAVSQFLETQLKKLYPDYSIFSEENCTQLPSREKVIVIDPIDGTQSYHKKEDAWCILVSFTENLKPKQGFIYQPLYDKMYFASKGQGAFLQTATTLQKLQVRQNGTHKGVLSHKDLGESEFLQKHGIQEIDRMYSVALKIAKVAAGEYDLYASFQKACSLWDILAPQCLIEEAGGHLLFAGPMPYQFEKTLLNEKLCAHGSRISSINW